MFGKIRTIHVRKAESHDYHRLSDVHASAFSRGWNAGEIEAMHTHAGTEIFIAREREAKNDLAGSFIVVRVVGDEAEILTLATHGKKRRLGFANALMEETLRFLNTERVKKLFLEVDESNTAAVSLYTSVGFRKISERHAYYAQEGSSHEDVAANALVMRLDLR